MKRFFIYFFLCTLCICFTQCKSKKNVPTSKVRKKKNWEKEDTPKDYILDHTNEVIKESDKREKAREKEQANRTKEGIQKELDAAKAAKKGKKKRKVNTGKFGFY